jgi:hypothetical protein
MSGKKVLLFVVMALSLALVYLVMLPLPIAVGIGIDSCPHPSFVRKHLCLDCRTEADALDFSKGRMDTNANTVLFGNPTFEVTSDGTRNIFQQILS